MTIDVGARLHAVRKLRGLSQRELAKRVGVTNSTISLIEQNRVSPSVGSLKKVLDGISMSLAEFFTLDLLSDSEQVFFSAAEQPDMGNDDVKYFLIGAGRVNRQMCVMREVMAPGSDTGDELLHHDGEEAGLIVKGKVEVTAGEQVRVLGPGDGYYFESRVLHRFRNVGDEEAVIFSANTPPSF